MNNSKIPVKDIEIKEDITVKTLINEFYYCGGFVARKIGVAAKIFKEMIEDRNCKVFLSFPACIVASGVRGVLREIIKRKYVDVIITTCGTWDHDIARSLGNYYHGSFDLNDYELRERNIFRLGNILVPQEVYGLKVEEFIRKLLSELYESGIKELSTYELSWEIGKRLGEDSILYWAWRNNIPVIIPGPYDGAVGLHIFLFQELHRDFHLSLYKDEKLLSELAFSNIKTGGLIIGGGISKHHTIWWNQFKDGLDYAVYITTAVEWDGSLSGARTREAISWRKISEKAKHITIEGDATVILPLIIAYVI